MNKKRALTIGASLLVVAVATASGVYALFTGQTQATGNVIGAGDVNPGATPSASAVGRTVTVSWSASTLPSGGAVDGYMVKRYDAGTNALQTILSACTGTVGATSCVESSVPAGSWKYAVIPVFANWQGAESAKSNTVVTYDETTPPINNISLTDHGGAAYLSGTNIFYNKTAGGQFTLTNAVTDAGSGPASSQTGALTGTTTGWTHTPSTVAAPSGGPYVSNVFGWAINTTSTPGIVVTGRDTAGNSAQATLTTTQDNTPPTAGSITYTNTWTTGRSVVLTLDATPSSDSGSGVGSRQVQRASVPLVGGVCTGAYTYSDLGPVNPPTTYTDTWVSNGNCYKYRYVVTDNVGNQATTTSGSVAMVDYAAAVNATGGLLSHWRLGEANTALVASDHFNGSAGALPGRAAEVAGTWTYFNGSNTEVISNEGRARRNGTGISTNYVNTTPSSQNYAVEADLYLKGTLASDMAGVIGRLDTTNNNYYVARWEGADTSWNIMKVTAGSSSYLNYVSGEPALTVGQHYRIRLEMTGTTTTTLKLYVNGVLKVTSTDNSSAITAAGKPGIIDGTTGGSANKTDSAGLHFENFQVMLTTYPRAADSKGSNTADYVNGPVQGATGALAGDTNTAVTLDGVNDHIQATNTTGIPVGANNRSMEGWFKTTSAARQMLFGYGTLANTQQFGLMLEANSAHLMAWGYGGSNDLQFNLPYRIDDGSWHHVVKTYDGTNITVYVDGVALPAQAATRGTVMNAHGFGIGAIIVSGDVYSYSYFNGSIDEVSMYTSALGPTTVTNHYQLGTLAGSSPVVTATGSALAYTENASVAVDPGVTVTDSDSTSLTAATVRMTTGYLNGQDTLSFTNQNGITGNWSAATGTMTLTGTATVANYQTALRSITYTNGSDAPNTATRTVTFVTTDGGSDSITASRQITVSTVNDAPVNSVPAAQTTSLNTAKVFSSGNGNLISISDPDAASYVVQVQLVSTNGTTTLSGVAGLTFSVGDGTADATMTFTGTATAVNTALAGLSFNPTTSFTGSASLQIVTNDQGHTGSGGALADDDTVTITVGSGPVVTTTGAALSYTENAPAAAVDTGATITNAAGNLASATVAITTAYTSGQDTLAFVNANGITGSWNSGTGVLTLSGTSSVANYQTALRSITYVNTSDAPVTTSRVVSFTVNDGTTNSNTATRTITITAVNEGPINSIPGWQTTATDTAKVFSTGNGNLISISDIDAASSPVQVQLVGTDGTATLSGTAGLSFSAGDGTADATMTFTGTATAVNTALAGLSFNPTTSFTGDANLQIVTNDQGNTGGGALTDTDNIRITVGSNGIFTTSADLGSVAAAGSSSFAAGTYTVTGSGADISSSNDEFRYVYRAMTGDGRLTARVITMQNTDANAKAGVMFRDSLASNSIHRMADITPTAGAKSHTRSTAGGSTSNVTETGIAAPYWVRLTRIGNEFNAEKSSNGTTWTQFGAGSTNTVTMGSTLYVGLPVTSHLDGTLNTATFDNVALTTPPTAVAGSYSVNQDNTLTVNASGVLANDTDPEGNALTASLVSDVTHGVLSLNANGSFTYTPTAGYAGADSFTYRASDGVFNSNTVTVSLTVNDANPANDAPVNSVPAAQTTTVNTAKVFSSGNGNLISINDPDAAANPVQVQLVSTNGTATLSGVTGLSFSAGDGTADATMTFTGTVSAINTALAGLSFNPTTSFTGSASLQIITNDQGNTGTGGALSDNDTVTITVNASSCGTQLLSNPGFENGATTTPWTLNASASVSNSGTPAARTGSWRAVLGVTNDDVDTLKQQVTIPAGCSASFSFWLDIDTSENPDQAYDTLAVAVRNSADTSTLATLVTLSNLNSSSGYVQRTYDLSAYAGQTITLKFTATMDYSVSTGFHLDDTSLTTS